MITLAFIIILLVIVAVGLLMMRIHQYQRPRIIRWQIGHEVFTFRFPFRWMHINAADYFKNFFAVIGACVIGFLVLAAVLFFIFLLIGFVLPVILILGLIAFILILIFVI